MFCGFWWVSGFVVLVWLGGVVLAGLRVFGGWLFDFGTFRWF